MPLSCSSLGAAGSGVRAHTRAHAYFLLSVEYFDKSHLTCQVHERFPISQAISPSHIETMSTSCHPTVNHPHTTICLLTYRDRGQGEKVAALMKSSSSWSHSREPVPSGMLPPALSVSLFFSPSLSCESPWPRRACPSSLSHKFSILMKA